MSVAAPHVPVLLDEVIDALAIAPGETHVDGTFGAGGYSAAMLAAGAVVHAFDRDPDAIRAGRTMVEAWAGKLTLHPRRFSEMAATMGEAGIEAVDGIVLDIGVSSMQLDQPERGFSFQADGPLDMRMEQAGDSAADFLNTAGESEIADVLHRYGEEPRARRVAAAIVAARPLTTTGDLVKVVHRTLGHHAGMKKDPATRTFQALRIHVNRELGELEDGLAAAEQLLRPGGRLAVVSFHSLEDRIVKHFFSLRSGKADAGSRHLPAAAPPPAPRFSDIARPVRASAAEIAANPRARSAVLRSARRTAVPPLEIRRKAA